MELEKIKIECRPVKEGAFIHTVSMRELHEFLESKQDFYNWADSRFEEIGAEEGKDYLSNTEIVQVPHQGGFRKSTRKDYFVTLTTAKEVGMLERNDKGRAVRKHFIEAEEKLRELTAQAAPVLDPVEVKWREYVAAHKARACNDAVPLMAPLHEYGSRTDDGRIRDSLRRASFYAPPKKGRGDDASRLGELLGIVNDSGDQMQLPL